jgi:nitrile hydratase accessory protein
VSAARETSASAAVAALPDLPRDAEGPVFREPWEAQAFAMAVGLNQQGLFTWPEWAATLSACIREAEAAGDCGDGSTYYLHWLSALERIVVAKGASDAAGLADRRDAFDRAARATPHGQPILLENDPGRRP